MFVGHALLAFAIAAFVARSRGHAADRAAVLGFVAALFATIPDVDMAYALSGVANADPTSFWSLVEAFWSSSTVTHRAVTHSLVIAVPASVAFALWPDRRRVASALLLGLVVLAAQAGSPLDAAMMGLFVLAGTGVATVGARLDVSRHERLLAGGLGLASHPFGDLLTGSPPWLFYPFDVTLLPARPALFADPTLNLLAAFVVELTAIWLGVLVAVRLANRRPIDLVDRRAALAAAYGVAAVVALPPPTLDVSYHFVVSVLAVGVVGIPPSIRRGVTRDSACRAVLTALSAITVGLATYVLAYVLVG